ncbi:aminotransferase class III-fold pyridoxal phosphate-dependent enzyme, partial [Acinetobacter baumannii]|nr:aminotransferase class III-fold pyridoxal phosphate-dependent enzyme [Acinetobacter baumannii]
MNADKIVKEDLNHIWHPASQMQDYEKYPALPIVKGKGAYLYTADGKKILDIISSWWCNLLGHCNEEISNA